MEQFKGRVMDPLLALVCPCFRENVMVVCRIVSFLCSLDDFLLKNVLVFIFGNLILKWRSFEKKKGYFLPSFHIFSHQGKDTKKSFSTYLTYINTRIKLTLLTLCLTNFVKIANLSCMVSLWRDSWC